MKSEYDFLTSPNVTSLFNLSKTVEINNFPHDSLINTNFDWYDINNLQV